MAHWSWLAADSHIEWEYEQADVAPDDRLRPAIQFKALPERAELGDYPYRENVLGRLAVLQAEEGTDARTELVFEMAPHIQ